AHAQRLAVELPYGQKRALEIATTLALDPELLLLDEPTQGMGHEDVEHVMALIKSVSATRTTLMVEHNMKVVAGISDRITVLARGAVLAEGTYAEIAAHPDVVSAYMGAKAGHFERGATA
ncbi:MAG: ATP-binding cassette domain-containing protein, partial [Betaproteobacteria bacterium]|nr:ATP-binding cassette domain-containing protein [Betaproteobacteria bacterium]